MTIATRQLQNQLRALWTTADVCRVLKVTSMTVITWRQTRGLPALEGPGSKRPAIRFVPNDVLAWAKRNDVPTYPLIERLKDDDDDTVPAHRPVKQPIKAHRPVKQPIKRLTFAEWTAA
jgi:hypothetical protein